jgi:hypothetical protein
MDTQTLTRYAEHELKYQVRKEISKGIRKNCTEPNSDPMVAGVTVVLGTILAMAVFNAILAGKSAGRLR